jgi:hypothetical protein
MAGNNLRTMTNSTSSILMASEYVAVNADLGPDNNQNVQGKTVDKSPSTRVVAKALSRKMPWQASNTSSAEPAVSIAVLLVNLHDSLAQAVSVSWTSLGISATTPCHVRDLWKRTGIAVAQTGNYTTVPLLPHASQMVAVMY